MAYKYAISANGNLRRRMKTSGVTFKQIADELGVCETTVSRRFRMELTDKQKTMFSYLIDKLAANKTGGDTYV